jgi:hypothetical protein
MDYIFIALVVFVFLFGFHEKYLKGNSTQKKKIKKALIICICFFISGIIMGITMFNMPFTYALRIHLVANMAIIFYELFICSED